MVQMLYIEDEVMNQHVFQRLVTLFGYPEPIIWSDTQDLATRIQQLPQAMDVVFVDINIAPLNGFEVLAHLKPHPDFANSKFIAFTAYVDAETYYKIRKSGFDGMFLKPIELERFEADLQRVLKGEIVWQG